MSRRNTDHAERVTVVERHLGGETLEAIAEDMGLNYYTARKWWRIYQREGWSGLEPKAQGPPAVGLLGRFAPRVKYVALRLKRAHPGWGVDKLRLEMQRRPSLQGVPLPHRSALAAYLAQFGTRLRRPRRAPTRRPASTPAKAQEAHQCWQMDFKGQEIVGGCAVSVAPFMVCDEASGAPLAGIIHAVQAQGERQGVTARTVQTDLRQVFTHWGLPQALRMDRDPVFVGSVRLEWPGLLLLWLRGLGVQPVINRAFRPTDNAIVERNHRTWAEQVLLEQPYESLDQVQHATECSFADRREYLPSRNAHCGGHPPATAFPTLNIPRQSFGVEQEAALFDLQRVDAYLSEWEWRRSVDSMGKISLAGRIHYVGKAYRGQMVKVRFEPQTREFVCSRPDGAEVTRLTLYEISKEYILYGNLP
jgi:transposase